MGKAIPLIVRLHPGNRDEELLSPLLPSTGANEVSPVTEPAQATPGKEIPSLCGTGPFRINTGRAVRCPQGPALPWAASRRRQGVLIKSRRSLRRGCRWEQGLQGLIFILVLLSDSPNFLDLSSDRVGQRHVWCGLSSWSSRDSIPSTTLHCPPLSQPPAAAGGNLQSFYARQVEATILSREPPP